MSGALTERAFVADLTRAGFHDVRVVERATYGLADLEAEPLFTEDLLDLMRRLMTPEQQAVIGRLIVVTASRPAEEAS